MLHPLLNIQTQQDLYKHPRLGASWEGFALEEIIRTHQAKQHDCYFWATHSGAELDLMIMQGEHRLGFEFKYADAPSLTKLMKISLRELSLDQLTVIYPGDKDYFLTDNIQVKGFKNYMAEISP